jgi:hypothetical protein
MENHMIPKRHEYVTQVVLWLILLCEWKYLKSPIVMATLSTVFKEVEKWREGSHCS